MHNGKFDLRVGFRLRSNLLKSEIYVDRDVASLISSAFKPKEISEMMRMYIVQPNTSSSALKCADTVCDSVQQKQKDKNLKQWKNFPLDSRLMPNHQDRQGPRRNQTCKM